MSKPHLILTRVANACVLLELGGCTVLTDPWFTERWYLRRGEPLGRTVAELPPLADLLSLWFRRHGSASDAAAMAPAGLDVVFLPPGELWTSAW